VVELAEPLVAPSAIIAKLLLLLLFHTKSSATMVLPHATAALATAKNAAYVGKAITEAINAAKNNDVATSELLTQLSEEVASRTVYSYGTKEHYADDKFAPSPIYSKLIEAYKCIQVSDSTSRILYAEPSSGKTSAAKMFMKLVLGDKDDICPGLMFTGVSASSNYFESIMTCFPEYQSDPAAVFKCLIAALSRSSTATQGSPWLILDEFNLPGEDNINMLFAETLFRQVAEKRLNFNLLFITQKKQMANDLLALNSWQKISPLPRFTSPDSATVLSADQAPEEFQWVGLPWTRRQLSMVVFLRYPKLREDTENIKMENGEEVFALLSGSESPTGACKIAAEREGEIRRGPGSSTRFDGLIKKSQDTSDYL
jgi:hypothetical protein